MKICTICNGGLFTSLMLEEAVKKIIEKLSLKAEVEHNSTNTFSQYHYDLIVADKSLAEGVTIPKEKLVVIDKVTDNEEIEKKLVLKLKELNKI